MDEVVAALLSEEMRKKSSEASKEALSVRGRSKEKSKKKDTKSKSQERSATPGRKSKVKCWNCGQKGHIRKDCKEEKKKKKYTSDRESSQSDPDAFIAALAVPASDDVWLVDSGASFHMTSHKEWFSKYEPYNGGKVFLASDSTLEIVGKGRVRIQFPDGRIKGIDGVLHIPGLARNLLSVSKLNDVGVQVTFVHGGCKMTRGSIVLAKGERIGTLYKLDAKPVCCNSVSVKSGKSNDTTYGANAMEVKLPAEKTMLWHHRLGHIGEKGLKTLKNKNLVEGLVDCNLEFDFCENCIYGKQNRVQFYSSSEKSSGLLDYIHSDVFGPVDVPSLSNSRYYVSFIDDYSRRTFVYFLKKKSEVFSRFKEFKSLVENQTGRKIKCLRTDNGGEFCNADFDKFCVDHGIKRHKTTPYTPQQNGVAERMNRSLMEKARSMLGGAGLEQKFWAEAVATACYLLNRSPTAALVDKTPMEAWSGKKPSLRHLRVFGCDAYAHVPEVSRSKLDNKAVKCIFIGYGIGMKGYKLWNPLTEKVLYSRSVIFHEMKPTSLEQPEKTEKRKEAVQIPLASRREVCQTPNQVENENPELPEDEDEESSSDHTTEEEHDPEPHVEPQEASPQEVRRSTRERRQPDRYGYSPERFNYSMLNVNCAYALLTDVDEPRTVKEAINMPDSNSWLLAMKDEMKSLEKNETWDLVPLPQGRKPVGCKWVFKKKYRPDGSIDKYKARLVAKGYSQKEGIDYGEIFSPVAKLTSIRFLLSLAAANDFEIEQMDVTTAFLHGDLEEEIYMSQPDYFAEKGKEHLVCKLKKSLYGLKQSPRMWYQKYDTYVLSLGFTRAKSDHCVYYKAEGDRKLIIALYVDDMLFIGNSKEMISELKSQLSLKFEMKDLGSAKFILGMEIIRDRVGRKLWLSQRKYITNVLERFNMTDCKQQVVPMLHGTKLSVNDSPKSPDEIEDMKRVPYASAVGSLMYAMVSTRPDIAQAVGVLSRFMANPGKSHWDALKRVLRYLKGTSQYALCYQGNSVPSDRFVSIQGYVDADWAGDVDTRRSTSGYVFMMNGGAISWMSKRQSVVALSTTEAEYMAATRASQEAIWLKRLCSDVGYDAGRITILCDSRSAICLAKNPTFHARTKQIDAQYHFVRDMIEDGKVNLEKVDTRENVADALTKPVDTAKSKWCTSSMGLKTPDPS
jgi:hypothetical protein